MKRLNLPTHTEIVDFVAAHHLHHPQTYEEWAKISSSQDCYGRKDERYIQIKRGINFDEVPRTCAIKPDEEEMKHVNNEWDRLTEFWEQCGRICAAS
ncbi:hypothetical protein ACQ4M3_13235 [Leptolyngbya sp. AN03gr2]|uniref:hypothetical protein n=1 Tax=unclassified Leptolyngbya TaxID=2650499 RepID=UPI003D3134FB